MIYAVLDIETTGSSHEEDQIFHLGVVLLKDLDFLEEKEFFFKTKKNFDPFLKKMIGKDASFFSQYPSFEEEAEKVKSYLDQAQVIIAHNKSFDLNFLNHYFRKCSLQELKQKSYCTEKMTRELFPEMISSNLSYLTYFFFRKRYKEHSALEDARATAKLFSFYKKNEFLLERKTMKNFFYIENNWVNSKNMSYNFFNKKDFLYNILYKKNKSILNKIFLTKKSKKMIAILPTIYDEQIDIIYFQYNQLKSYHLSQKKLIKDLVSFYHNHKDSPIDEPYFLEEAIFLNKEDLKKILKYNFVSWLMIKKDFNKNKNYLIR